MQAFGLSCCVFVHAGSSTVSRMSHMNYLLPHCCCMHEWSQPSMDACWISCVCDWLVFAGFSGNKVFCNGQIYGMPCIEIFSLGTGRWAESPHLLHLSLFLWANLGSKLFLYWLGGLWSTFLCCTCFCLVGVSFFFLYLPFGNSVCWWHIKLIWATWGSPATCLICLAVALELSIFLASWHTLLVGNLSRSTLPSLIVLETKSSSSGKNQKISLCSILAVSGGYLARLICARTMLNHSSMLLVPYLKLVNKSKWALTSFAWACKTLQRAPKLYPS